MSAPLVDIEDIEAALGRTLSDEEKPRALFVADKLSAAFRQRARQTFAVETYVHRLKVDGGGRVFPTRAPLVEVLAVFTDEGAPVRYERRHGYIYVYPWCGDFVVVTYTAGLAEVPAAVRLQLADTNDRYDGAVHAVPPVRHMGGRWAGAPIPRRPGARGLVSSAPRRARVGDGGCLR